MKVFNKISEVNALRWTHLFWIAEIVLSITYLPAHVEQIAESVVIGVLGIICCLSYEKMIGKIFSFGFIAIWLFITFIDICGFCQLKQGEINRTIFAHTDWTLSYGIVNIISYVFMLGIPMIQILQKHIGEKARKVCTIMVLLGTIYILGWCYFGRDKLYREALKKGQTQVEEIEAYYVTYGNYPSSLEQLNREEGFYTLSEDGHSYTFELGFDHWYNIYHTNSCIFTFESVIYDSDKKKWTHIRP